jgi:hypothetical protein
VKKLGSSSKIAGPKERPNFVLGSRPATLRAPTPQRIKPMTGQTQYGKQDQGDVAGSGFGDTGMGVAS